MMKSQVIDAALSEPGAFASPRVRAGATSVDQANGRAMQEALRAYQLVASLVDREVMSWHALPTEQQASMDAAIRNLNTLAADGAAGGVAAEASFVLGVLYQEGRGMPHPKPARAAECYQAAAEAGSAEALFNLAGMTRTGVAGTGGEGGVAADPSLAFCMLEVAARQGHTKAMFDLAAMHANGEGCDNQPDEYAAQEWFEAAAAKGHALARTAADRIAWRHNVFFATLAVTTMAVGLLASWGLVGFTGNLQEHLFSYYRGAAAASGTGALASGRYISSIDDDFSAAEAAAGAK